MLLLHSNAIGVKKNAEMLFLEQKEQRKSVPIAAAAGFLLDPLLTEGATSYNICCAHKIKILKSEIKTEPST